MVAITVEANRITLVIEGLPEDSGRVRFNTFVGELQSFAATLGRIDRDAGDGKQRTYFEVAELSYSSPIRVAIEPRPLPKHPYLGEVVIESLRNITGALRNGHDLSSIDADLLEDIRSLARPVGKSVKSVALLFDGEAFELTEAIAAKVDSALAVEEECEGTSDGMLEQINIHLGANTFHIYPLIGPKKITCHFPSKLYDDAVAAVGRRVEVMGTLRYRAGAQFPHQIAVSGIDVIPPDDELPDWDDLRGRAPNATGKLTSEAFIRELRDGWV